MPQPSHRLFFFHIRRSTFVNYFHGPPSALPVLGDGQGQVVLMRPCHGAPPRIGNAISDSLNSLAALAAVGGIGDCR